SGRTAMSLAQLPEIEFAAPEHVEEACELLARFHREGRTAWAVAGCTDWMVERHMDEVADEPLSAVAVDLTRVKELRGIWEQDGVLRVGAAETMLSLRRSAVVRERVPMLAQMAAEVGAMQIQARATLGGNLISASPAADGVTALFALDAQVVLRSENHERVVPVTQFYSGYRETVRRPDELVVRFEMSLPARGAHQLWRKVGTRKAQSISKSAVAALAETDTNGRIVRAGFGVASVAERVLPLSAARALLLGARAGQIDLAGIENAVDLDIRPIDDLRSTARYRRHVTRTLVRRFVEGLAG
ncbi:MAG: FAD binding domain-containing protein, partial [Polyangiaceae bacterium]|nr:FAD binding domain-containing protein [Polyangiaceae bacterium]